MDHDSSANEVDSLQLMFGVQSCQTSKRGKVETFSKASGTQCRSMQESHESKTLRMGDILGNLGLLAAAPKKETKNNKKGKTRKKTSAVNKVKKRVKNKLAPDRKLSREQVSETKQGNRSNLRTAMVHMPVKDAVRHEVFVVHCEQHVQIAFVQKTTAKGGVLTIEASCIREFLAKFDKAEHGIHSVCSRRHGSGSNAPMIGKKGSMCVWKQLVKLPKAVEAESTAFDHKTEAREWGEKLAEGLNCFQWTLVASGPFSYGGLVPDVSDHASLESVLLDKDVESVRRAMSGITAEVSAISRGITTARVSREARKA